MLPPMSATELSVADPRQLLEARLEGMQKSRYAVAALFFGVAALFIGLLVALGPSTGTGLMCLALAVVFLAYGFLTWWQIATATIAIGA
jgi:Flp pilus assembly protein TadB